MRTAESRRIGDDVRVLLRWSRRRRDRRAVPRPFLRASRRSIMRRRGGLSASVVRLGSPLDRAGAGSMLGSRLRQRAGEPRASRGVRARTPPTRARRDRQRPRAGERGFRGRAGRGLLARRRQRPTAACVAQALHWLEPPRFFAESRTRAAPGGGARGPGATVTSNSTPTYRRQRLLQARIRDDWPPERRFIDEGYASFDFVRTHRRARVLNSRGMDPAAPARLFLQLFGEQAPPRAPWRGSGCAARRSAGCGVGDRLRERTVRWPFVHRAKQARLKPRRQ